MNRLSIVLLAVLSLMMVSCKEKKTPTVIIAPKPVEEVKDAGDQPGYERRLDRKDLPSGDTQGIR